MSLFRSVRKPEVTHNFAHIFKSNKSNDVYTPKSKWKTERMSSTQLTSHCRHRGFVYPGSENYGGLKGAFDYGPMGVLLKRNIWKAWQEYFVNTEQNISLLDSSIVLHPQVWENTGHVANFSDPLIECKKCDARHRADHAVEEKGRRITTPSHLVEEWQAEIAKHLAETKFKCSCGSREFHPAVMETMLMKTVWGSLPGYLRPETAQGIFLNYDRVKVAQRYTTHPFGIAQMGKAFRNEIAPRDFIYRMREFEQIELEIFCQEHQAEEIYTKAVDKCYNFLQDHSIPSDMIRKHSYPSDELAHYAKATTDIEFNFPFGWGELWGIANRGDYDMKKHNLGETIVRKREEDAADAPEDRVYPHTFYPHVIEPSVGLDRLFLAFVHAATVVEQQNMLESGEVVGDKVKPRTVMRFHPALAPIKVAVMPIVESDDTQQAIAADLAQALSRITEVKYEPKGYLAKRYARHDDIGTPWCLTVDNDTLVDGTVTVRSRDTKDQVRMPMEQIIAMLQRGEYLPL